MGLLVDIREQWAAFLQNDADAAAFFNPDPETSIVPIPILTEKLGTIEQALNEAKTKTGLHVIILTVSAGKAKNPGGSLWFEEIKAVARVTENPKLNKLTGVCASDCAEAIAWFTRNFKVNSTSPMKLENILLAPVKEGVAYDVIFNLSTGLTSIPVRSVINPNPNPT